MPRRLFVIPSHSVIPSAVARDRFGRIAAVVAALALFLVSAAASAAPADDAQVARLREEIAARGRTVALVALVDPRVRLERDVPGATITAPAADRERVAEVAAREARWTPTLDEHVHVRRLFAGFAGAVVDLDAAGLEALLTDDHVAALTPDLHGDAQLKESVPLIRADVAQAAGRSGSGVAVAVLDSGVNTGSPDFAGALLDRGYHFLDQGSTVGAGGIEDDSGHGSNVAGIVAARGGAWAVGVAPEASLYVVRVITAKGGWSSDWALAADYVTVHRDDFGTPIRILNMSLGTNLLDGTCPCDFDSAVFALALAVARASGLLTLVAAGNQGSLAKMPFPACFSSVLPVGATYDASFGRNPAMGTFQSAFGSEFAACFDTSAPALLACFTDRNACLHLVAPGSAITSAYFGGPMSIGTFHGTSQAAPHASGVAAQILGADLSLGPDLVAQALLSSARPRVMDPQLPGASYAFLDAVDAESAIDCLRACTVSPCQTATCDAAGTCHVTPRPLGASCGDLSCVLGVRSLGSCDGSGRCVPTSIGSCGAYACHSDGPTCRTSCAVDGDCASGFGCSGARCLRAPTPDLAGAVATDSGAASAMPSNSGCGCSLAARSSTGASPRTLALVSALGGLGALWATRRRRRAAPSRRRESPRPRSRTSR